MFERRLHWPAIHGVELAEALVSAELAELAGVMLATLIDAVVLHVLGVGVLHDVAIMLHCTERTRGSEGPISCAFRRALA